MYLATIDYYKTNIIAKTTELSTILFKNRGLLKEAFNFDNSINKKIEIIAIKTNKSKATPDITIDYGEYIVSKKFRSICLKLNVVDFDFIPLTLLDSKNNRLNEEMYVMIPRKFRDLRVETTLPEVEYFFKRKGKFNFRDTDLDLFQQKGIVGYLNSSKRFKEEFESKLLSGLYFVDLRTSDEPLTERLSNIRMFFSKN